MQPIIIKYDNPFFDVEQAVIPMASHIFLLSCILYNKITVDELPVFKPNEFFWKNHLKEGEEKWKCYARVIREIMIKHGKFNDSKLTIEDKFEYRKILFPNKKSTD